VLARSPLLTDSDLIERIVAGPAGVQALVARRPSVSMTVSAVLAEIGEADACAELLGNGGAQIATMSLRRIAGRFGHVPRVRAALLAHPLLPPDCRHLMLLKVSEALRECPLVVSLVGRTRAERITKEARAKACVTLVEMTGMEEHPALVEHLRHSGELTTSFLIRAVAHGKIDFFAAVLASLACRDTAHVVTILAGGRDLAVLALLRAAGLPEITHRVVLRAVKLWRDVANGRRLAGPQEVSWLMLAELGEDSGSELAGLIRSIHLEALRQNARNHALAIAAA
jgi:uncharacterized protein (DUF2336 family)